ncbi:conserved hypothetical protein [uncultured Desulfobacterium sp.]|uniref:Uncharacterized protein n=1 Tax=uncultured Desulfobacterium sp. TaxID=201089 RepID=A0A445N2Y9_9BACT|nr:conserved hypothetical protein [uncultured Desulfobacterium sp.]
MTKRPIKEDALPKFLRIDSSSFGLIVIDGRQYISDLVIFPDGHVDETWWRKSSHRLSIDDIEKLVASGPDVIVVGTGVNGLMDPEPGLKMKLSEKGIDLLALPNPKAIERFNELCAIKKVGACFHLTC